MRGSHNLFTDVKITTNVGKPICFIITNYFFRNFLNNLVKYVVLLNHDILSMIAKSYLNLVYVIQMENKMDGWTKWMVRWLKWLEGCKVR
jgi:hypothetical protein